LSDDLTRDIAAEHSPDGARGHAVPIQFMTPIALRDLAHHTDLHRHNALVDVNKTLAVLSHEVFAFPDDIRVTAKI
jgi:hypothetical protein